jgi:hypothetical protein
MIRPEISLYDDSPPLYSTNTNLCRSCDMQTFLVLKSQLKMEGFSDDGDVEQSSSEARDTRGQLSMYLTAMQAARFRTHGFGILIVEGQCRLLHHTHSGITVTKAFSTFKKKYLQTFLWRLSNASPAQRGIDTTYRLVHKTDVPQKVLDYLNVKSDQPVWLVPVAERHFYITAPFTRTHVYPIGRGTRCFIAMDEHSTDKYVLKDVWRIDGYNTEGEVYAKLKEGNVPNIPNILASGDVEKNSKTHSCGIFPPGWIVSDSIRIHHHYRIVLGVVGRPLLDFKSTHELTCAILGALEG